MNPECLRPYWFDATALVKLIYHERGSDHVQRIVQNNTWIETTWLCVAETHGVMKRHLEKSEIKSYDYHKKLYLLRAWIDGGRIRVRMAWLDPGTPKPIGVHEVRCLAEKHNLDFSDAIQLVEFRVGALAAAAGLSEAVFVSSDAGLLKAARAEGIKVWNPEDAANPPT